jgi:hypothetical protein
MVEQHQHLLSVSEPTPEDVLFDDEAERGGGPLKQHPLLLQLVVRRHRNGPLEHRRAYPSVPGTVLAKWRQEYPLFTPLWQEAWSGLCSQNEGSNGNLKKSALDSIDNPQLRLPHGRVAQTLLNAVIIFMANLRVIQRFLRDQGIQPRKASTTEQVEPPPRE